MIPTSAVRFRSAVALVAAVAVSFALAGCGSKNDSPTAPRVSISSSPGNVQVIASDQKNIVSWDASGGATSYNLYFKVGAGATTADTKIAGVTSPYTHGSLTNGTLYSYVVTAVNSGGESGASAVVQATPTAGPIFVSASTGLDAYDGSQAHPVRTLAHAYAIAQGAGRTDILMEAGSYAETPSFIAGINVAGGYDLPGWNVGASRTTFTIGTAPATATGITTVTAITRIDIQAPANPAGNSIALSSSGCTSSLVFTSCHFVSAAAGAGSAGANGSAGGTGNAGTGGGNGSCDGGNGLGGPGGTAGAFACAGGAGGAGGQESGAGDGVAGTVGGCSGGGGGPGGAVGDPGASGTAGGDGGPGADGADGTSAPGSGSIVLGNWAPLSSANGLSGGFGLGGGGGGGGGAQQCFFCDNGGGNGGGGGGAGGEGGIAGGGAQGGFGSFAVLLNSSSPTFGSCTFQTGAGGSGGAGGAGGAGGSGGIGGNGGLVCTGEIGAGGHGGHGGAGGGGGGGAGGPGGPSYGVYRVVSTPTYTTNSLFIIGSPGLGGAGGLRGSGSGRAPMGATGPSGITN